MIKYIYVVLLISVNNFINNYINNETFSIGHLFQQKVFIENPWMHKFYPNC